MAALSTAANVAAMISLADMAFKSGTQVFDLYCRYRDASASMSQLVDEIQAATSNTTQVRIFVQEFEASTFAIDNGHTLPQIQQLLCLIDQEFKLLRKLMHDTPVSNWQLAPSVPASHKPHKMVPGRPQSRGLLYAPPQTQHPYEHCPWCYGTVSPVDRS